MAVATKYVNGQAFAHTDCEFDVNGKVRPLVSINYTSELTPGMLRENAPQVTERSLGEGDSSGSFVCSPHVYQDIIGDLGDEQGFMAKPFAITITKKGQGRTIVDKLVGVRITSAEHSSEGSDPATVTVQIHIMEATYNGKKPY